MQPVPHRLVLLFVIAALALPASGAQRGGREAIGDGSKTTPRDPNERASTAGETRFAALADEATWREMIERDRRLSFSARTSGEARAVLESQAATPERRAIALFALGSAGSVVERGRLLRLAREGADLERRAAILALGEMGAATSAELEDWVRHGEETHAECALLAMLRSDRRADRRRVEEIAADPKERLARVAGDLLVFTLNPGASQPTRTAALFLRLRFEAARRHGLVDGENWRVATIRGRSRDLAFARDVVLHASTALRSPYARDHVFAALQGDSGRARLSALVAALPRELSDLVENDLWRPRDADDWRDLLLEIGAARVERMTLPAIRAAAEVPEVRYQAIALASLAGDEDLSPLIGLDPTRLSSSDRAWVCLAIGARTDPGWLERFALLGEDPDPRVRAAFLVARFRQRQKDAIEIVGSTLRDGEMPLHAEIVDALCAAVHDPAVGVLLETRLLDAPEAERTRIAAALCLDGRLVGRTYVRAALAAEPPPQGDEAATLVRALRRNTTAEDIDVLRALFPSANGDAQLDLELALALLARSEPDVLPIVRAALWGRDFDVSVLAGGVLSRAAGLRALADELRVPPADASSGDLRRVGFAIGEWGGLEAVQALARELRWSSGSPALQGALLGALATRTQ